MYSLFGDHFLKRFFGSHFHQRMVNPACEAITLPANETDKSDEPGYNPPDTNATPEHKQTGEVNHLATPEHGPDQPTIVDKGD